MPIIEVNPVEGESPYRRESNLSRDFVPGGDDSIPKMGDPEPQYMFVANQAHRPKTKGWNIAALVLGVASAVVEVIVPVVGAFVALPLGLIAAVISGVAISVNKQACVKDRRATIGMVVSLAVVLWASFKIGAFIAAGAGFVASLPL